MGKTLRELGVVASMGSRGDAYDNAACESAIGTIKLELVEQHVFATATSPGSRSSTTSKRSTTRCGCT